MDVKLLEALARGARPAEGSGGAIDHFPGKPAAAACLATVLAVKGSAPRGPGASLYVEPGLPPLGTVGGGRGELLALAAAEEISATRGFRVVEVEMLGEEARAEDAICGGRSLILVEAVEDREAYRRALALLEKGESALLACALEPGAQSPRLALFDGEARQLYGPAIRGLEEKNLRACLSGGQAYYDEALGLFYRPFLPEAKLLILGAGHVGLALAKAARGLGFTIFLADHRAELLMPDRIPEEVHPLAGNIAEIAAQFPSDLSTYAVVVTPGHLEDLACVRAALGKPFAYRGLIGSGRKVRLLKKALREEGFPEDRIGELYAPIGLDIGAETPEELAIAILAEIIGVRRRAAKLGELSLSRMSG